MNNRNAITTQIKYLQFVYLEIVYLMDYGNLVLNTKELAIITEHMIIALMAGNSDPKMKARSDLSSFDSFVLERSKQAVIDNKERFTQQIQICIPQTKGIK